jgi:hypothetical protein
MLTVDNTLIQNLKNSYIASAAEATARRQQMQQLKAQSRALRVGADPTHLGGYQQIQEATRLMTEALHLHDQQRYSSSDRRSLHLAHCFAKGLPYSRCEQQHKIAACDGQIAVFLGDRETFRKTIKLWLAHPLLTRFDIMGAWEDAYWALQAAKAQAAKLQRQAAAAPLDKALKLQEAALEATQAESAAEQKFREIEEQLKQVA